MSPSQVERHAAPPADALPLRSLTAVWVLLGAFGVGLVGLGMRSAAPDKAPAAAQAGTAKGPSKEQVRQRQEHIAITQRALELAQKERKAAAPLAAAPASAPGEAAPAAAAAVGAKSEVPPAPAAAPSAKAAATAPPAETAPSEKAPSEKAPSEKAEPAPAPAKPAAKSGLDAMRDDIAADFE